MREPSGGVLVLNPETVRKLEPGTADRPKAVTTWGCTECGSCMTGSVGEACTTWSQTHCGACTNPICTDQ